MSELLYEHVAVQLTRQIEDGVYGPGDRLPGVRRLSRQFGVSIATAVEACRLMEDRGIVQARPRSGFFVSDAEVPGEEWPESESTEAGPTLVSGQARVLELVQRHAMADIVPLGAAVPPPDLLPLTALDRCIGHVRRVQGRRAASYDFPPGAEELRVQVARRMAEAGCRVSPEDVVITAGCQEALVLSLRSVAAPGDTVAIESPTFYGILQAIESQGMRALEIPTHGRDGMDLEALETAIDRWPVRACVAMPNFGNPLGHSMPEHRKAALVDLLASQGIPLIEDDVYGELGFADARPWAAKAYDQRGGVLYCSSFSKTLGSGLRIGWAVPGRYREAVTYLKYATAQASPTLQTLAIARYLAQGGYDRYLRRVRRAYQRQVSQMAQSVRRHFPEGTRISRPRGGFVLWVELPAPADTLALQRDALAAGISIAPGPLFSPTGRFGRFLRLNCAHQPAGTGVADAIAALGRLLQAQTTASPRSG
ncbi:PLP-dependent aminotransferase family protein [Ectothiorhodospiraceae bacterium WFHF3C12]|nr:PLP-dependent aminotransferase family protein [Ectothiorhodospiraceae bacterium WFHF3C12]